MPHLILRIYVIHLFAILGVTLSTYFPGLDIILALIYIIIISIEGLHCVQQMKDLRKHVLIAIIWQLPGLLLIFFVIGKLPYFEYLNYYALFILEIWGTPLIPLVSLLPNIALFEQPLYYYFFFANVIIMTIIYLLPSLIIHTKSKHYFLKQ